jgi:hypothetical protein
MGVGPGMRDLISEHGWIRVAYDTSRWIPCPPGWTDGTDVGSWSAGSAKQWWDASGIRHSRRDVAALARSLAAVHDGIYVHVPCHMVFLYLRANPRVRALPVCLGVWRMRGEREAQLRRLAHADDPKATKPPIIEPVHTELLGDGLKTLRYLRQGSGPGLAGALEYAWRSEEHQTDLSVFTTTTDLFLLTGAMADIDEFTRGIAIVARE